MRSKLKTLFLNIMLYAALAVPFGFFAAALFCMLERLELISRGMTVLFAVLLVAVLELVVLCYRIYRARCSVITKFDVIISCNYPILLYIISLLAVCFCCIDSMLTWNAEEAKDITSISWSIFGLNIAIFLVWYYIIIKYLKNKKPKLYNTDKYSGVMKNLEVKIQYRLDIQMYYRSIWFLGINVSILLVSTALVYLPSEGPSAVAKILVAIAFFMSGITIFTLLFDIFSIGYKERGDMLAGMEISAREREVKKNIDDSFNKVDEIINLLENSSDMDLSRREALIAEAKKQMAPLIKDEEGGETEPAPENEAVNV